jgi:lipoprotein-anchoring transpeptidase ErfK/SrfK
MDIAGRRRRALRFRPAAGELVMRRITTAVVFLFFICTGAWASLEARIDVSAQTMRVYANGALAYTWKVSTARKGYRTPRGTYRPTRLHKMWYSRKYDNSPMPHSVFFHGGYAIHGTSYLKSLGRPASHGCIRLAPGNARTFFDLVKAYGSRATRIVITN